MNRSSPGKDHDPVVKSASRRRLLLELAGITVAIAIPFGAAVATARPIANPPSRAELDILSDERKALIDQRSSTAGETGDGSWKTAREERKRARDARKQAANGDGNDS